MCVLRKDWKHKWKAATLLFGDIHPNSCGWIWRLHHTSYGLEFRFPGPSLCSIYHSPTTRSVCRSYIYSTFVPGKNGDDQLRVLETWSSARMLSTMIYGLMHKQGCTSIFMRWIIRLFLCFIIKEMNNFMQQIWQTSRARKMCQNLQYKINILFRIISCTFIKTNLIV